MNQESSKNITAMQSLGDLPTYTAGVAQAAAYRLLKKFTEDIIANHDLSMMQWYIIGTVYESGEVGASISELAKLLDTTLPYITTSINLLQTRGIVTKVTSTQDSRIKRVVLNKEHVKMVHTIENDMRTQMRNTLYRNIEPSELLTYVKVLYKLNALLDANTVNDD